MTLLFKILCANPELRATIQEIQANEWLNQKVDISKYKWEEVIRDTEFHANNAGDFNREEDLPVSDEVIKQKKNEFNIDECENKVEKNEIFYMSNINDENNFSGRLAILSKSF